MLTIEKVQSEKKHKFENHLIHETSPYLLQHAHNPVNWHSWGEVAFEKAKKENKPILLSIGYSTCHWCHVMEHESFEDEEIAKVMNDNYICIKVDREQRPDVDSIYMSVVQGMTGHGGWPMTVWLTPDRTPYYGGTYFPARDGDRGGHPGFLQLIQKLSDLYRQHPVEISKRAQEISQDIAKHIEHDQSGGVPDKKAFDVCFNQFDHNYDSRYGGFGFAPKFPRPSTLQFLMHYSVRSKNKRAMDMALGTLEGMLKGGIYDQIGGGFHRYSVDTYWLVPHFEKMLYDQSQIVLSLLDAYQINKKEEFKRVTIETLDYVRREMTDPKGGFYSATDADSEGEEGKFFVWSPEEIAQHLNAEMKSLFCEYYGVTLEGNFEGKNILFIQESLSGFAKRKGLDEQKTQQDFEKAKKILYEARSQRVPPLTDDKIITSWNGLMIAAFARAALVLNIPEYTKTATKAADFILQNLWVGDELHRSARNGRIHSKAFLDDYTGLIHGLLELFETTGDPKWFDSAKKLQNQMIQNFWDSKGGFYSTSSKEFFAREKPFYDGAEPSGNAVAAWNLLKFSTFLKDESYREYAKSIFQTFAKTIEQNPTHLPQMLVSLDYFYSEVPEIIMVDAKDGAFESLLEIFRQVYLPNRVLIQGKFVSSSSKSWDQFPTLNEKTHVSQSTAYVCKGYVCQAPSKDSQSFQKVINAVESFPS